MARARLREAVFDALPRENDGIGEFLFVHMMRWQSPVLVRSSPVGSTGAFVPRDSSHLVYSEEVSMTFSLSALCSYDCIEISLDIMTSHSCASEIQKSSVVLDLLGSTAGSTAYEACRHWNRWLRQSCIWESAHPVEQAAAGFSVTIFGCC